MYSSFKFAAFTLFFLLNYNIIQAGEIALGWDPNLESDLAGYKLHYGRKSQLYETWVDVGNKTVFKVTGLTPGMYYFALTAYNKAGYESSFSNEVMTTIAAPLDATPPIISNVLVSSLSHFGVNVSWTTNENSDSQVEYGPTASYGASTSPISNFVTSHSVYVSDLEPTTTYHLRAKSRDASGNLATSGDLTVLTLLPPPASVTVK
jgi:hypothetical protein